MHSTQFLEPLIEGDFVTGVIAKDASGKNIKLIAKPLLTQAVSWEC